MKLGRAVKVVLSAITVLICIPALAQQVRYFPDFATGLGNITINGTAHLQACTWAACTLEVGDTVTQVLALTDGYSGRGAFRAAPTSAWFNVPQPVAPGFTSYFRFQFRNATTAISCCSPGDGFAFVVQNAATTDTSYGANGSGGLKALGVGNGGVGYAGIPNSLAIEFDTNQNSWDPSGNHIAVQSCGTNTNGPVHLPGTYTIGTNSTVSSCLVSPGAINHTIPHIGVNCATTSCTDGSSHEAVVEYESPSPTAPSGTKGRLRVWLDPAFVCTNTSTNPPSDCTHEPQSNQIPAIDIPYTINAPVGGLSLALDSKNNNTLAYVGFTAAQTNMPQATDILAWEFTPHSPVTVQQPIPSCSSLPCPTVTFSYGSHVFVVSWYKGFVNDPNNPILANVVATPWDRIKFYNQRLVGSNFANESCIVYSGTGGNCMVYSVTCQQMKNGVLQTVPCPVDTNPADACTPGGSQPGCLTFKTAYYTTDTVDGSTADALTAEIGTNTWISDFHAFYPNVFDSGTVHTKPTTSDFVATVKLRP